MGRRTTHTVTTGLLLVVALAGCSGDSSTPAVPRDAASTRPAATTTPAAPVNPVVNGRIVSIQRHLRTRVDSYSWVAFDSAADLGLFTLHIWCDECRPKAIQRTHINVVAPTGRVATLVCPHGRTCPARRLGNEATLGPGPDELTVEAGDRTLNVIGYDGTVRRSLDLTASIAQGRDFRWLAWSPDGSRLAVQTSRELWVVEGDATARHVYSPDDASFGWPVAWSPDGQSLLFDRLVRNRKDEIRTFGADVVVVHVSSTGSSIAMTPQTLYRSNRHFDWAGNLAWSPDGTRIAVRVKYGIVEISAKDGRVLARHPKTRANNGMLIWLRRER